MEYRWRPDQNTPNSKPPGETVHPFTNNIPLPSMNHGRFHQNQPKLFYPQKVEGLISDQRRHYESKGNVENPGGKERNARFHPPAQKSRSCCRDNKTVLLSF